MSKVNILEEMQGKTWLSWFLLGVMKREVILEDSYDAENVDVKLVINGVEHQLDGIFEELGNQFESMTKKAAKQMVQEKFDASLFDKFNKISYLAEELKDQLDYKVNKEIGWD